MWQSYALQSLYLITMKIGIIGNLWVICSIMRNSRPHGWLRRPSDCLRTYIFVLALVDLFVVCLLALRLVYIWDETLTFGKCSYFDFEEIWNCRGLYFVEQLSKMISMFCLASISVGRYITICKPFSTQVRKHFHRGLPATTLLLCFFVFIPIFLTVKTIDVTADRRDCRISDDGEWNRLTGLFVGACFMLLLMLISVNYAEIVRHVHRKFLKRKARQSASCNGNHNRLSEPRYVREMTSSTVRVAVFHIFCWLPFCFIAMTPTETCSLVYVSIRAISEINDRHKHTWVLLIPILANWLTYLNSALNWIFYAVLNRDLRELIRFSLLQSF
uniref:G_PROTEIN_RECEP_F1_2 domain-containing protein n=1 Tax=Elaeophora elaphi TaxID=1147741 RepID=A0A0R3RPK4_9BILA